MPRRRKILSGKYSAVTVPFLSAIISFIIIFAVIAVFAFALTKFDATDIILSVMSTIALCIGAYAGGYISGRKRNRNGLLMGVLCGVFIFIIILILGTLFSKTVESFSLPIKLILTLACAGIGGVVGVNSRHNRY